VQVGDDVDPSILTPEFAIRHDRSSISLLLKSDHVAVCLVFRYAQFDGAAHVLLETLTREQEFERQQEDADRCGMNVDHGFPHVSAQGLRPLGRFRTRRCKARLPTLDFPYGYVPHDIAYRGINADRSARALPLHALRRPYQGVATDAAFRLLRGGVNETDAVKRHDVWPRLLFALRKADMKASFATDW
jgi:hypothetical protein